MANFNIAKNAGIATCEGLPFNRQLTLTAAIIAAAALANTSAADDTLTFRVPVPAGSVIRNVTLVVPTNQGLQNTADTGFDSVTASVGDGTSNLNHIPAKQVALLGTEIKIATADHAIAALAVAGSYSQAEVQALRNACATLTGRTYAAADFVTVLLTPKSGKNLSALNAGRIELFYQLINEQTLAVA